MDDATWYRRHYGYTGDDYIMRGRVPDWKEEDFRILATTVINTCAQGGSLADGIREYIANYADYRTEGACRFKLTTKIMPEYGDAIDQARKAGEGKKYRPSPKVIEHFGLTDEIPLDLDDEDDVERPIKTN